MPAWWTVAAWRSQFPADDRFFGTFDLQAIKDNYQPDASIHYCPDFAGPRKKGRPKKNSRAKSALEKALEDHNGTGKKKRRVHASDEELAGPWPEGGSDDGKMMGAV